MWVWACRGRISLSIIRVGAAFFDRGMCASSEGREWSSVLILVVLISVALDGVGYSYGIGWQR
jgi:hypothetical protein